MTTWITVTIIVGILFVGLYVGALPTVNVIGRAQNETADILNAAVEGFCRHWDFLGAYPVDTSALRPFSRRTVNFDAWGNPILLYVNVSVGGQNTPAVFLSAGPDGQFQSQVVDGQMFLSDSDMWAFVTEDMLNRTERGITEEKLSRADDALQEYYQKYSGFWPCILWCLQNRQGSEWWDCLRDCWASGGRPDPSCVTDDSETCILILYKEDLLEGKDTYDQWGQNLVLDSDAESFYSKGPDQVANSSDDVT